MAIQLSDAEIAELIQESKPLPDNYRERMTVKPKRGHKERELDVTGARGNPFRLILRQGISNPLDFSVILAYCPPASNLCFRLRRYNGKSHEHTNQLEGNSFYAFHIHTATERYQASGFREDAYAEPSERFADFAEGCRCMLKDCGFQAPAQPQGTFWSEDL
jgi:hypothetical protein